MAIATQSPSRRLIKALGLPEYTFEFNISFKIGERAVVECKYHLNTEKAGNLEKFFTKYKLSEVEEDKITEKSNEFKAGDLVRILGKRTDGCSDNCSNRWSSLRSNGKRVGDADEILVEYDQCGQCKQKLYRLKNTANLWHPQDLEPIGEDTQTQTRLKRKMDSE